MAKAFDVIGKMFENDPKGEHAVAFISPDNFLEAKSGKDGWGFVKMAVNNDTVFKMLTQQNIKLVLIAYDIDNYKEIAESIDKPEPPVERGA
jgi:hypothetical protein